MKKIIILFFAIVIFLPDIYAEDLSKYDINDCTIYLDNSVWESIVTKDTADDESRAFMENNMMYLYAEGYSNNDIIKFDLIINKTDNIPNMHTLTDEYIEKLMNNTRNSSTSERNINDVSIYKTDKYTFVVAEYNEEEWYFRSYGTVINGNTYAFKIYRNGELDDNDIYKILNIIDKLEFEINPSYNNSNMDKGTSDAWTAFLGTLILSGIALIYDRVKNKRQNKKDDNKIINEQNKADDKEKKNNKTCEDKKIIVEKNMQKEKVVPNKALEETKEKKSYFKCDNCGTIVEEDATICPACGEVFDDENTFDDVDKKYSDLTKLKELLDKKIISQKEFEKEKKKVLKQ